MIVDAHTLIWESPTKLGPTLARTLRRRTPGAWAPIVATPEAHAQATLPADAVMVLGLLSRKLQAELGPQQVAEHVQSAPHRLLGVGPVDPQAGSVMEQWQRIRRLGLVGASLAPALQRAHPQSRALFDLYAACQESGLPFWVQSGASLAGADLALAQPMHWDAIAGAFPKLTLVIGEMGWPFVDQTLALLAKHDRVFADLAGLAQRPSLLMRVLSEACELGVMDRLLLASGFPFGDTGQTLAAVMSLKIGSRLVGLVQRDTLGLLGIPSFGAAGREPASSLGQEIFP